MAKATSTTKSSASCQTKPPKDYEALVEHIDTEISVLKNLARLLMGDIEWSLSPQRGRRDPYKGITLMFQLDAIEATTWLAGSVWSRLADLDEYLLDFHNARAEQERPAA